MTESAVAGVPSLRAAMRGRDRRPHVVARRGRSTRSTSAASPTATATAPATSRASAPGSPTCATSGSTPSGSRPGTSRRSPTAATTSPTTGRSIRPSARSRRPRRSSPRRSTSASGRSSTSFPTTCPTARLVPGGPRRRARVRRSATGSGSTPGAAPNGDEPPTELAVQLRRRRPGPARPTPTAPRASGTCTCSRPSSPTSTGTTPTSAPSTRTSSRFWFDRGAAGVRIDSAALLVKDPTLPEVPDDPAPGAHPNTDRDEIHDIYRSWRAVADSYPGHAGPRRRGLARRTRHASRSTSGADELHTAFNFDFMARPWDAASLRASIDDDARGARAGRGAGDLGALEPRRHPAGDPLRPGGLLVRLRAQADRDLRPISRSDVGGPGRRPSCPRRCPARCTSTRATSSASTRSRSRPTRSRTRCTPARAASTRAGMAAASRCRGAATPGRSGSAPRARRAEPWLTQPAHWADLTVERQAADPDSMLNLYREALRLRRRGARPRRRAPDLGGLRAGRARVHARRSHSCPSPTCPATRCRCRPTTAVLLASADVSDGHLPPDATAWLRPDRTEPTEPARREPADER